MILGVVKVNIKLYNSHPSTCFSSSSVYEIHLLETVGKSSKGYVASNGAYGGSLNEAISCKTSRARLVSKSASNIWQPLPPT